MYSRWRKIRGTDKNDLKENKVQLQSSFKEFEDKFKQDWLVTFQFILVIASENPEE